MQRRLPWLAVPLAVAAIAGLAVLSGGNSSPVLAQQTETIELFMGCNNVSLTFATGTPTSVVAAAVSPSSAIRSIWRYNNASQTFQGFSPLFPAQSDLQTVNLFDPVFICMDAPGVFVRPLLLPGQTPTPAATGTATATATGTATVTVTTTTIPTVTATAAPSATASATMAPSASATAAPTASATASASAGQ
jgi:hypothetical protein